MDNAILHCRRLVVIALAVALALAVVVVLPRVASADPPHSVPDTNQVLRGFCNFPVRLEITDNHLKLRPKHGGDYYLFNGRGVTTLTNVRNPENQLVDRGGSSARITPLTNKGLNGDVLIVARGHNVLADPREGFFLTIGKVTFTVEDGPFVGGAINIRDHHGKLIDVCARLA